MRGAGLILAFLTVVTVATVVGCHADPPPGDDGGGGACAPGLAAVGRACAPLFDACASDEVPLLGGGCRRVGVRECPGGIAGPPDWTCKRIGVEECAPAGGGCAC